MQTIRLVIFLTFALLILSCCTTVMIGWPLINWYHNYEVWRFAQSIESIALLPGTRIIASKKRFGLLWANGNHCDAQVMVLVETLEDDAMFYSKLRMPVWLSKPFFPGPGNIDVISIKRDRLYQVIGEESYPLYPGGVGDLFAHTDAPSEYLWDVRTVELVMDLAEQGDRYPDKHYYVLVAWDQTRLGYDMMDLRCH